MELYLNVLKATAQKRSLRLTVVDDAIYKHFRTEFPKLRVDVFDEAASKTVDMKLKWNAFCSKYKEEDKYVAFFCLCSFRPSVLPLVPLFVAYA